MTSDLTSEHTGWPRAFRFGECRSCPGGVASSENMTFETVPAADGTYEMLAHQEWCPELNPNPSLDI